MISYAEAPQNRICIYIANPTMIKVLKEMYPNADKVCNTIWELHTSITLQDNWIINSFYGKPNKKYCKNANIPIIKTAKQLLVYKLLLALEVSFEEIKQHLLENSHERSF